MLFWIRRAARTVLGVYLKRTCSRDTSASSALGVLHEYALYTSTHALTHSLTPLERGHTDTHTHTHTHTQTHLKALPTKAGSTGAYVIVVCCKIMADER